MRFQLEDIHPADRQKIIEDAKGDPAKWRDLSYAAQEGHDFPKRWAVDRERQSYLYLAPVLVRKDTAGPSLYFFFRSKLYEIRIETAFGNEVAIEDSPPPSLLPEFKKEIAAAFAAFGRAGNGSTDFFGNPDAIVPRFVDLPRRRDAVDVQGGERAEPPTW